MTKKGKAVAAVKQRDNRHRKATGRPRTGEAEPPQTHACDCCGATWPASLWEAERCPKCPTCGWPMDPP